MSISVLIVEDHPVVRSGIRMLLTEEGDIDVLAEASNGREALQCLETITPDLLLLDISMPEVNGLEVTQHVREKYPTMPILILTMHEDERYFFQLLRAGATGYIVKGAAPNDLVSAVRAVAAGQAYLYPSLARLLAKEPDTVLSARELEVLQLTAQGLTAREVGKKLSISSNTVERHRANIMSKLGVSNRAELIRYAIRRGLLSIEDL
ncbi:MAG: response regulator transcription factor [Candidatus Eremiobacteraeota bacterium]|nr:response regulator transcription factor [Candidatus Eremiobacteraeota bacterium]